ncbi:MAG TPA: sterol desaturase family protein [Polyangiaceae bacterium]|nr:sterol desaturase family protein [Polyangiaceae bacterium]
MPTLLELFTDPISLAFFAIILTIGGLEARFPARQLPVSRGHRARGALSLLVFFLVSSYLPYLVGPVLAPIQLADLSSLGTWAGAACAMLLYQALGYAYHRSLHRFDGLFRAVHQAHHSAERLDVAGAFLFGPLDMVGWTLCSTLALTVLGVTPEATIVFVLGSSLLSTFQHANLRTPRWLGYLVQRPESHSLHHARGVHRNNYADLPIFDLIFGTFENPRGFAAEAGFYDGASARVSDLLLLRDVTRPRSACVVAQSSSQCAEPAAVLSRR